MSPAFSPTPGFTPEPEERSYLPWILALASVLALCVASVLILGGLGDDGGGNETDVIPSGDPVALQSQLRSAQTSIETYSIDHDGSYEGATLEELTTIEPTLAGSELTVTGQSDGYVLSGTAGDATFTITRSGDGVVLFSCTPPGVSGCDDTGSWGTP